MQCIQRKKKQKKASRGTLVGRISIRQRQTENHKTDTIDVISCSRNKSQSNQIKDKNMKANLGDEISVRCLCPLSSG
jgi:hypothetical protein